MLEFLDNIDSVLLLWLNGFHNSFFDGLMYLTSEKWVWVPVYVALFVATMVKFGFTRRTVGVVAIFAITIALADNLCADYIRPLLCRPRPTHADSGISAMVHIVNGYHGGHYGMPSCHSANSFGLAAITMLIFRNRKLTAFIYLWAVFHTYSRIYLGVHYPGDILVGGLVGTAIAFAIYHLFTLNIEVIRHEAPHPYAANIVMCTGIVVFLLLIVASATGIDEQLLAMLD